MNKEEYDKCIELNIRLLQQYESSCVRFHYGHKSGKIVWSYDVLKSMVEYSKDYDDDVIQYIREKFNFSS